MNRHWPVFWASLAVVLVTWGLVPTQAGIFTIRTVTLNIDRTFAVSTYFMPASQQPKSLFSFPESTYRIVALNETLPPFMARNFTLAPFKPREGESDLPANGIYTSPTTMYTLTLYCEEAKRQDDGYGGLDHSATNGCSFNLGLDGNLTIGDEKHGGPAVAIKQYTAMYVGYHSGDYTDYYLENNGCPDSENTTFYAAFAKSKVRNTTPTFNLLCSPFSHLASVGGKGA